MANERPLPVSGNCKVSEAFANFKFGIGDLVCHKTRPQVAFIVTLRALVEDVTGVARKYEAMTLSGGGEFNVSECGMKALEYELEAFDEEAARELREDPI